MLNLLRVLLLGLLVGLPAPSWSGSMTLLGVGAPPASGTPFSITAVSNNNSLAGTSSYTFNAQAIGVADTTRIVVVALAWQQGSATITSLSIGGNAAAPVGSAAGTASTGPQTDIWALAVAAGTTANVVVNFSAAPSRLAIEVYRVVGTGSSVSTGAANSAITSVTTLAQTATIPAGGGAIGVINIHTATPGTITPTNLSNDANVAFGSTSMVAGNNVSASGSTSMGFSWTSATDSALSIATFNP